MVPPQEANSDIRRSTMNIAISPRFKAGTFEGIWNGNSVFMHGNIYVMAKHFNIGLTLVATETDLDRVCETCDGMIVQGSPFDVDPSYYGGEPFDPPQKFDEYAFDAKMMKHFADRGKPMFGICGGIQALNVFFGGTLKRVKELRDPALEKPHSETVAIQDIYGNPINYKVHNIEVEKDSFVYDVFGVTKMRTNTYHSWAVDKVAPGFRVVAKTIDDNIVEAIECKEKHVFATQWHPELAFRIGNKLEMKLFENFIKCCEEVSGK